jgi:Tol biopolymer transport system component
MWMDGGLFRVGVDGSGWKELYAADNFDWDTAPVWTKDGHGILIAVSDKERQWRLLRVPAEGGKPAFTGLADTLPKDRGMDFDLSPDGARLVFVAVAPTISSDRR